MVTKLLISKSFILVPIDPGIVILEIHTKSLTFRCGVRIDHDRLIRGM